MPQNSVNLEEWYGVFNDTKNSHENRSGRHVSCFCCGVQLQTFEVSELVDEITAYVHKAFDGRGAWLSGVVVKTLMLCTNNRK